MDNRNFTVCNIEKHINNFYKKSLECKDCNIKRGVKGYYDNKDKISIQQKEYYEKKEINYKQNDYRNKRNTDFKDLVRSYAELQNKLKALEEEVKLNRFLRICKNHSLTIHFVKFVTDSIQKNNGINIILLVDIFIEKSMVICQHFFHKEN